MQDVAMMKKTRYATKVTGTKTTGRSVMVKTGNCPHGKQNSKANECAKPNHDKLTDADNMAKTCATARVSKCAKLKSECAKPRQAHRCHRTWPKHVQPQG